MRFFLIPISLFWSLIAVAHCQGAGCGDITICARNPPYPPDGARCTTLKNYCSGVVGRFRDLSDLLESQTPAQGSAQNSSTYSIELKDLSSEQLTTILQDIRREGTNTETPQSK